jgi:cytochrome c oxidase subunit I
VVGGFEALLIRLQLAGPNNGVLSPQAYDQVFTMHGTTMIFLVIMPMLFGFSLYFVPLMIGTNEIAYPRLNALGYWVFLFGGMVLYASFLGGGAPDAGWFAYAPLSSNFNFTANAGMNYWGVGLITTGIGSIGTGVNLMITTLTMRAPGMTIRRLPLFVWMVFFNTILLLVAIPALNAAIVMLLFDRLLHANFFESVAGGQPLLWQHAFWTFGHPEVYILILPAWGMISEIIPVFSRRPIYGYEFIAGASIAIVFLSLVVWGHHMFTAGMGHPLDIAFAISSMLIAVPTGIKVFNWTATTWAASIHFTTAMLFALAFIVQFTIGGVTGVMFAAFPVDWQMEDSYFVVAHLHYVLMGGTAFALWAAAYYWFPKMTGKMLSERLGRLNFWLAVVGFNLAFMVQHLLGFMGMARRIETYPDLAYWHPLNLISTIGAFILGLSVLVFLWNLIVSLRNGEPAGDNPWGAWSLEWATSSPPGVHNFEQVPPVRSRRPLWDLAHPENPDWKHPEAIHGL